MITQEKFVDQEPEASDLQTFLGNLKDNFLNDDVDTNKPYLDYPLQS